MPSKKTAAHALTPNPPKGLEPLSGSNEPVFTPPLPDGAEPPRGNIKIGHTIRLHREVRFEEGRELEYAMIFGYPKNFKWPQTDTLHTRVK